MKYRGDTDQIDDIYDMDDEQISATGLARAFGLIVNDEYVEELHMSDQFLNSNWDAGAN